MCCRVKEDEKGSRSVLAWDRDYVMEQLRSFVQTAGVSTVPSLQEYPILPDKVRHTTTAMRRSTMEALKLQGAIQESGYFITPAQDSCDWAVIHLVMACSGSIGCLLT